MELKDYLSQNDMIMEEFAKRIGRAQSIVSRLAARKHRPDPVTAVRIVKATRGAVNLDDLYGTPRKYRADVIAREGQP